MNRLTICFLCLLVMSRLIADNPNIIVIFSDDHGWPDLGAQGILADVKTPYLDEVAASGINFTSGYVTAPQCIPSRSAILSGSYQQRFGVDDNRFSPLPRYVKTIPERLQEHGYFTGMVGKWHLDPNPGSADWLNENTYKGRVLPDQNERIIPWEDILPFKPYQQGFDEFFEGHIYDYWANFDLDGSSLKETGERVRTEKRDRLDIQTEAALAFIDRNHEKPFFLYLSYFAPHVPLESTKKYLDRFPGEMPERRRYALAMISAMDDGVGLIRNKLSNYGLLDNTLIFFIGDNGAPLKIKMEDRTLAYKGGAWDGSMNEPLNGEKGMLAEGGIRVPFLLSWPSKVKPGQVIDCPVSSLDVGATALAILGLGKDKNIDGENLIHLIKDPNLAATRPLYWRFWGQGAIRRGAWKYLRAGQHEFLFDLDNDKEELNNLALTQPERVQKMRKEWEEWNLGLKRPFDGASGGLNSQEVDFYGHYFLKNIN